MRNSAPRTRETAPPIPNTPWDVNFNSRAKKIAAKISSEAPSQLIGSTEERRQPKQRTDGPHDSGENHTGRIELSVNSQRADREQDERQIRIADENENPLPKRRIKRCESGAG